MAALPEEILFKGICDYSSCSNPIWICRSCYRRQIYCSERCGALGREEKCRGYRRHHQQGNGRKKHNKRQEAYRLRQAEARQAGEAKKVTDHSSQAPPSDGSLAPEDSKELQHAPNDSKASPEPQKGLRQCRVCSRKSVLVEPLSETKRVAEFFRRGRELRRAWDCAMRLPVQQRGSDYVKAILDIYVSLPDTPRRTRRDDRYLAQQLHRQSIPLFQVETAMLLATARRVFRDEPDPLEPIRSLRYFVPALEEVRQYRVDEGYLHYLRDKLRHVIEPNAPSSAGPKPPRTRQMKFSW